MNTHSQGVRALSGNGRALTLDCHILQEISPHDPHKAVRADFGNPSGVDLKKLRPVPLPVLGSTTYEKGWSPFQARVPRPREVYMSRLTAHVFCRTLEILIGIAAFQWALIIQKWSSI